MGRSPRLVKRWVGLLLVALAAPGWLHAQTPIISAPTVPDTGSDAPLSSPFAPDASATPTIQLLDKDAPTPSSSSPRRPSDRQMDSFTSQIAAAIPRNMLAFSFEAFYDLQQPTRAEYLFAKPSLTNDSAFRRAETRVDYQELNVYGEISCSPVADGLSFFFDVPCRFLNPEVNSNRTGPGNTLWGFKYRFLTTNDFIATFMLRVSEEWGSSDFVDNNHWSVEPGLLAAWRVTDKILVEGEFRSWNPIGGSDFAGSFLRYGLGVSYGQRASEGFWYMPVLETVGWSILSGKTMIASSPTSFVIEDARGQTIINAYLGLRAGYGQYVDFYVGYGRCFTGDAWQRDSWRIEMRLIF